MTLFYHIPSPLYRGGSTPLYRGAEARLFSVQRLSAWI